ncbi:MAG TPA: hypothetical protein VM734_29290 [Kofleriaceae bacterium]|jgi:hypothetical protein|nr:hypothetical protein [Kofleriaceae bacterium]
MSHTQQDVFFRWVLRDGADPDALRTHLGELGDRLLYRTGRRSPDGRFFDVDFDWEFRSEYPLPGAEDALFYGADYLDAIWLRVHSGFVHDVLGEDDDVDGIGQVDLACDRLSFGGWRPCRYGFDELRVVGAAVALPGFVADGDDQVWRGAGSYLTRNCQAAMMARYPDDVPAGPALARPEPIDALSLLAGAAFARVEWRWRGRVVHVAAPSARAAGVIQHETADGWENCVDDLYLDRIGDPALRRPSDVYARDRDPWFGQDE